MKRIIRSLAIIILLLPLIFCAAVFAEQSAVNKANDFNSGKDIGTISYQKTLEAALKKKTAIKPKRELVYGLTLFDGFRYQGTFCPQEIDTIYMIAGRKNIITANKTDVFFWPLTKEYIANWAEVNEKQKGVLVISKNGRILKELHLKQYLLFYPDGYAGESIIITGRAAEERLEAYQNKVTNFYTQFINYYKAYGEYQQKIKGLTTLDSANNVLKEPERPKPLLEHVTTLNQGFILNLPPGVYKIFLKNDKGNTVPESVKKLVSFTKSSKGTGFEIIPEDKWTHPTKSDGLDKNIFAQRNQVFYLKPFKAVQYNGYAYTKLTNLSKPSNGRGLENEKTWVHTLPLLGEKNVIEIIKNGQIVHRVREKKYIVRQQPGYTLGYKIVEFDSQKFPNESPTFSAYKIEMPGDFSRHCLRLVNQNGKVIDGSVRNLSIVRELQFFILLIIATIPLISGVVVLGMRSILIKK
jgi:hypothetical protein